MEIIKTIKEMQQRVSLIKQKGKIIGYVPTMGFLHEGHLALVEKAHQKADIVIMSIFVNPLQFGPNEDFDRYPRDFERDEQQAIEAGVDFLFYPEVSEMYKGEPTFKITVLNKVDILCGSKRPGHFEGVATVLMKLFSIVQPTYAMFGMKDAQQVAIVTSLVQEFNFPIEIIPVETVREQDGLAKSSRNVYLSKEERLEATAINNSLKLAKKLIIDGERNPQIILEKMEKLILSLSSAEVDYIEVYSFPELKTLSSISGLVLIAVAARFTNVRLIDNMTMEI
ncbi:pantoate--beta-alanine ligase [Bacillus sp. DJP31]|uniref:pantoate--beta-alanine ligase n=1 Tax=Bacillus sp. DJP31 TaxID=3409789 RepID=UPI003BB634C9